MTKISDLSEDLVREILSRVPLTYLTAVRSTCKTWNELSRNLILGQKAAKKQFLALTMVDYSVRSLRFELQGIRNYNYDEDLAEPSMKPISIPNHDQVEIFKVFHCEGLLLCACVIKYKSSLLVWNPYLGKTRLIQPISHSHILDEFALGYDNNRNHKITRFSGSEKLIYDFSSDSWRVLDLERDMYFLCRGVSLKGNTYFCCLKLGFHETEDYLLCFDFTRETFGPRLPLPCNPYDCPYDNVTLSFVSDDKLALLYDNCTLYEKIDIWITTKIEPNAVLWSKFLRLDMIPLNGGLPDNYRFDYNGKSFFIDEEKKVAVIFDIYKGKEENSRFKMAYIVGEDGCFRSVNMGEVGSNYCSLVCSSYVPSLVQLHV